MSILVNLLLQLACLWCYWLLFDKLPIPWHRTAVLFIGAVQMVVGLAGHELFNGDGTDSIYPYQRRRQRKGFL